jgi:hypothetical protein
MIAFLTAAKSLATPPANEPARLSFASLGIPVLAEGVENEQHIDFLCNEGCLQVQGFLFGRPQPRTAIEDITGTDPGAELGEHLARRQLLDTGRAAA